MNSRTKAAATTANVRKPPAEETFVLRANPSVKRYNIARFEIPQVPKFSELPQPVLMYREPEKVFEEDEEAAKAEVTGYNPALRKRRRRRRKSRTANWLIDYSGGKPDNENKKKFVGTFEGGQSSMYVLFVKNRHNDEFSVIPVENWFRFKKPISYNTLTLEEAEEMNNEKKRAVERWLMRHKTFADDKGEANDVVSAPRVRTGATGGSGSGTGKKGEEGDDIFDVKESKPRRVGGGRAKVVKSEAMGDDGGDFDEKFDDDESDAEIHDNDDKAIESESEEEEELVEGSGKLTETGQAMKDLLKRAQNGEADPSTGENDENDEAGGGSDEEYSAQDMEKVRRDLGGNIIRDKVPTTAGTIDEKSAGTANGDGATGSIVGAVKPAGGPAATDVINGKRKADDATGTEPAGKQAKLATAASSTTRLTEAGVQQELLRYGGRMKSRDLLKKLKKLLVTDDDRALLKDILRTICEVEKDAIEGNLFVLKTQFR